MQISKHDWLIIYKDYMQNQASAQDLYVMWSLIFNAIHIKAKISRMCLFAFPLSYIAEID